MAEVYGDTLEHIGVKRRSGRYPWGSGDNPYQHSGEFLGRLEQLKKEGLGDTEIARAMGYSTNDYRAYKAIAKKEHRAELRESAKTLREDGHSYDEIAKRLGFANDSSVRNLLNEEAAERMSSAERAANKLKEKVDSYTSKGGKGFIDVGAGVEHELGVSSTKVSEALALLRAQGYETFNRGVPQATNPGQQTILKLLAPPGTTYTEVYDNSKVHSFKEYDVEDVDVGETTRRGFQYPESLSSKRLKIHYGDEKADDGSLGVERDGTIELRRGVKDISLGNANYAQVRIMVDGTHYLKGMAVYSDNMPDGVDVVFNTNKPSGTPVTKVLKPIKDDKDNPFGSLIKEEGGQSTYIDSNGEKKLSLINKRADAGDWTEWKNSVPSQFLAKQSMSLINRQLKLAEDDKVSEFNEICELNNPTVKKVLLESFASDCDGAAIHLQAAALPRQQYHVILPDPSMKETEVYAPNYKDGEKVALIRYPHGGTFEIPELTVNNKLASGKKLLGPNPSDAICINSKVAEQLSGADFDGDTVMVIPTRGNGLNRNIKINSSEPLTQLKGFSTGEYAYDKVEKDSSGNEHYYRNGKEFRIMRNKQQEMGQISNLITDMTLKGAVPDELARAVKHSMVVIDAEKHKLDYTQSSIDNDIASLKKKYQARYDENGNYHDGASTLISRAKSKAVVQKRTGQPWINKDTGELEWEHIDPKTGEFKTKYVSEEYQTVSYKDPTTGKYVKANKKNGLYKKYQEALEKGDPSDFKVETKTRTINSTAMAETKDAFSLVSKERTPQELAYAEYANKMKALANQARKEMVSTGKIEYSKSAASTYAAEVAALNAGLNLAEKNSPRERIAQVMAKAVLDAKLSEREMTAGEKKKEGQRALSEARSNVGAAKQYIKVTQREWDAIQAGAVAESKLIKILNNTDMSTIKQYATPRTRNNVTTAKEARIHAMAAAGRTNAQIAEALGLSASTVQSYLKGGN